MLHMNVSFLGLYNMYWLAVITCHWSKDLLFVGFNLTYNNILITNITSNGSNLNQIKWTRHVTQPSFNWIETWFNVLLSNNETQCGYNIKYKYIMQKNNEIITWWCHCINMAAKLQGSELVYCLHNLICTWFGYSEKHS